MMCLNTAGRVANNLERDQTPGYMYMASDLNVHYLSGPIFQMLIFITKTRLYNFDPLKPHFYTVNLGFTGVYIIFLISAQT